MIAGAMVKENGLIAPNAGVGTDFENSQVQTNQHSLSNQRSKVDLGATDNKNITKQPDIISTNLQAGLKLVNFTDNAGNLVKVVDGAGQRAINR